MLRTQPTQNALSQPWFEACREGRLTIQRCGACGHFQFYPRIVCSECDSGELAWVDASGEATLRSFSVVHTPVSPAYEAPYVVALVALKEGPTLMSNLVDVDARTLTIGAPLRVRFEAWSDDVTLPVFTLADDDMEEQV